MDPQDRRQGDVSIEPGAGHYDPKFAKQVVAYHGKHAPAPS